MPKWMFAYIKLWCKQWVTFKMLWWGAWSKTEVWLPLKTEASMESVKEPLGNRNVQHSLHQGRSLLKSTDLNYQKNKHCRKLFWNVLYTTCFMITVNT